MANGQQTSFSLAFVALAMILSAGEANVRRELEAQPPSGGAPPDANLEAQSPSGGAPPDANLEAQPPSGSAPPDANLEAQPPSGSAPPNANLEASLQEMLGASERAKEKVLVVGNSQMVKECNKTYGDAIDHLNKALALAHGGIKTPQGFAELETIVKEAMKDYEECDRVFAVATRPSPFVINDTYLKSLASKFNSMAEADAQQT
ncbi:hypothetical protein V6N13_105626 [Hibiscus sabdariffa]|uniref:Pectinesterase inhibitor domain-containing protein n=1 Tax=Hibiscus sabdariffa TaxID=183260 RepID=A0ABR2EY93_9ROSI